MITSTIAQNALNTLTNQGQDNEIFNIVADVWEIEYQRFQQRVKERSQSLIGKILSSDLPDSAMDELITNLLPE